MSCKACNAGISTFSTVPGTVNVYHARTIILVVAHTERTCSVKCISHKTGYGMQTCSAQQIPEFLPSKQINPPNPHPPSVAPPSGVQWCIISLYYVSNLPVISLIWMMDGTGMFCVLPDPGGFGRGDEQQWLQHCRAQCWTSTSQLSLQQVGCGAWAVESYCCTFS